MTSKESSPTLAVLAAGLGSRYGGLKQIEPFGPSGETLMDYSIYDAHRAGFSRVVFIIRREMKEAFDRKVGQKYQNLLEVEYAFQEINDLPEGFSSVGNRERPWGTGHAVWAARKELENCSFSVINADDYYGPDTFSELILTFSRSEKQYSALDCAMIGFRLRETLSEHGTVSRGICKTDNGLLLSVEEWSEIGLVKHEIKGKNSINNTELLSGDEIVSMNVWAFPPTIFPHLENQFSTFLSEYRNSLKSEFYLPFAVDDWISSKNAQVKVYPAHCSWMGVTYQRDKEKVRDQLARFKKEGIYPDSLFF